MMKKLLAMMIAVALTLASAAGCTVQPSVETGKETEKQTEKTGESSNEIWAENMNVRRTETVQSTMRQDSFDEKFLRYLSSHASGNYMASPLSFRYALGLLLAGASGETKAELLKALGVDSEEEWVRHCLDFNGFVEFFAEDLGREIERYERNKAQGYIPADAEKPFRALRVANSVWKNTGLNIVLKEAYQNYILKNYAAEYRDFTSADAVRKINEWADIKTEHLIPELLPAGYDTGDLAIVLMNALYFRDSWVSSFWKSLTKEEEFHTRSGQTVKKEFMHSKGTFAYYEDEVTKLIVVPMKSGVSMTFVLGSAEGLAEKVSKASSRIVDVAIPKIDLETSFASGELVEFLRSCGVSLAMDPEKADFSAMTDLRVSVGDIIQKTRIKLDEEGVEAAAVTAMIMPTSAPVDPNSPAEFIADQPFAFCIYTTCNDTTAILFAGEIVE